MLTEPQIRNLKPRERMYRVADAKALCVEISPAGSKLWRYRYRWAGKGQTLALGVFPEVSLKEARRRRDKARLMLDAGVNPAEQRKTEREAATRFSLDSDGALSVRLPRRRFALTREETAELHAFLDATRAVFTKKV